MHQARVRVVVTVGGEANGTAEGEQSRAGIRREQGRQNRAMRVRISRISGLTHGARVKARISVRETVIQGGEADGMAEGEKSRAGIRQGQGRQIHGMRARISQIRAGTLKAGSKIRAKGEGNGMAQKKKKKKRVGTVGN